MTAKENIESFAADLESYMKKRGLPSPLPRHIDHYLNMPRSELALTSTKDLGEIEFELLSYAYYLQDLNNKQVAKAERCKFELERIVGPNIENYQHIYGQKEKWAAAVAENPASRKYNELESASRSAAARTSYLTQRIESLAKCIEGIARRRHNG